MTAVDVIFSFHTIIFFFFVAVRSVVRALFIFGRARASREKEEKSRPVRDITALAITQQRKKGGKTKTRDSSLCDVIVSFLDVTY